MPRRGGRHFVVLSEAEHATAAMAKYVNQQSTPPSQMQ